MENKEINYCPKCGNKLTGNEKFCSVCGSPVLDFFSNEKEQIISESQNKIYVKKKKSIVKRILVGGGILFIALIVFGIFLPEDESNVGSENVVETEKEAEVEKKVETTKSESVSNNNFKSDVDVVETLKNRGRVQRQALQFRMHKEILLIAILICFLPNFQILKRFLII